MKPKIKKFYVIAYNSGDLIQVYYGTPNWKVALEYYGHLKNIKRAEKKGDFISLDVIVDYLDGSMLSKYKTIFRKEVKA